jgi:hypothetical protein
LLELARLIGQSDPFGPPPGRSGDSPRAPDLPRIPDLPRAPDLPTRGPMARPPSSRERQISPAADRYDADHATDRYDADYAPDRHDEEFEREAPRAPRPHPFPFLQTPPSRAFAAEDRDDDRHFEPAGDEAPYAARGERFELPPLRLPEPDRAPHGHDAYADEAYPTARDQHYPAGPEPAYPAYPEADHHAHPVSAHQDVARHDADYPEDGAYQGQYADAQGHRYDDYDYDDGAYEDEELGGKGRNIVKIVVAALGIVMLGGGAAVGYRMFQAGTDGPPPLIRADTSPTKVVPTPSLADAGAKAINDRLGGSDERMLSREEQPIDLKDPTRVANGGVVAPVGGGGTVAPYPSAAAGAPAPSSPASTEPKRVRTVTIHSDAAAPPPPPGAATAAAPPRAAAPRSAAPPTTAAAPSTSVAPMALTPQSQPAVAAVDAPRTPAPARTAPRPETGSGLWVVQISAQKTEAEAQSAFRAAQTKYSVLSGYQPLIRKKDQGDRGVFFAAQVGPLARDEANQLCENLKGAGGSCFIQKN